jgi:hypothetical protein
MEKVTTRILSYPRRNTSNRDNEVYTSSDPNLWDYVRQKDITKNSGIEPDDFHSSTALLPRWNIRSYVPSLIFTSQLAVKEINTKSQKDG